MRKGLPEPGANNQLIMAGHEAMLAQWFHRPLHRADIELARTWFSEHAAVRAFPHHLWDTILASQPGEEIHLPVDVWGFPGGQTFLPGVPCLFFEGMGRDLLPGTGNVPVFRPHHPGDQGPADETGHAARRRVWPAVRAQ
jgi:hypothetical protein